MAKEPLTEAEQVQLAALLHKLEWPVPPTVFNPLLAAVPTDAFEVTVIVEGRRPRVMLFRDLTMILSGRESRMDLVSSR